jgi:hypothetical protein
MDWIPVTDPLPPFGKSMLACSRTSVGYFVTFFSPTNKKWYRSFGAMPLLIFTQWMPLPELPQGSVVV